LTPYGPNIFAIACIMLSVLQENVDWPEAIIQVKMYAPLDYTCFSCFYFYICITSLGVCLLVIKSCSGTVKMYFLTQLNV